MALNLHGLARSTEDLDLFIAPDEANVERLKQALHDAIDDTEIENTRSSSTFHPADRFTSTF